MIALLVITILSLAVAAVMSVVAWRLAREEQRRSAARVEALTAEIHADDLPLVKVGEYLPPEAPARTQGSLLGALAIGVLFVGSVVGLAIVFSDGTRSSAGGDACCRCGRAGNGDHASHRWSSWRSHTNARAIA